MRKFVSILLPILVPLLILPMLCGCTQADRIRAGEERNNGGFEIILEDDRGCRICLSKNPQRIISLVPGGTETLFALGLGERLVGVTEHCNYPPEALKKDKAGGFSEPNIEQIIALRPELVVAVRLQEEDLACLDELGIPVIILDFASLEDVYRSMELLGLAVGEEENAHLLLMETKSRIDIVKEKLSPVPKNERVRVYYEVSADPSMSVGSTAFIHELIETAGGNNIFADLNLDYPRVNAEAVVSRNPEVMLFPSYHGSEELLIDEIINRPGWRTIDAIEKGRIFKIDADIISRPGPRVADIIEEMATIFYPETWWETMGK